MSPDSLQQQKLQAEIKQLSADARLTELRAEELELQNARGKTDVSLPKRLLTAAQHAGSLIKTALAVSAFWFGFWQVEKQMHSQHEQLTAQLKNQNTEAEKTRNEQAKMQERGLSEEREVRKMELRKAYWTEQLRFYEEGADVAAKIAKARALDSVTKERERFWALYWGQMSLVEHLEVEKAMVKFGDALSAWEARPAKKPEKMTDLSYELAHCFRSSLQKTWSPQGAPVLESRCPHE